MSFTEMAFVPADGLKNITTYPTEPASETAAREMMQEPLDQLKTFLNETLIPALEATAAGQSGAHKIGSTAITGVTGENVNAQIADLKAQIDGVSQGAVTDGSITTAKLATDAVETAKIQDGAVTTDKLADGIFGTVADGAVTTDKLADSAVTAGKIGTGAVTAGKIGVGAVTADKIATGAVTADKIDTLTAALNTKSSFNHRDSNNISRGIAYYDTDSEEYQIRLYNNVGTAAKYFRINYNAGAEGIVWAGKKIHEWNLIYNANLGASGSVTVPSMSGYSEVMLQIRNGSDSEATLLGSAVAPLSSGLFLPKFIRLPIYAGTTLSSRTFGSTSATAISYLLTVYEGTQRLYVYVR